MPDNKQYSDLLRSMVEQSVGKTMQTPADFGALRDKINERCGSTLSDSTLKRFWGYVKGYGTTRMSTFNILSRFVGFADWDDFVSYAERGGESSSFVMGESLKAEDLNVGELVVVTYPPDRRCVFRRTADGFVVTESVHSKLNVGDTFRCNTFIIGEPCYLYELSHDGKTGLAYVMGKSKGLTSLTRISGAD